MNEKLKKSKILFLTNNLNITKPLFLWLSKYNKVIVYEKKLSLKDLKKINPNMIISYNYRYLIKKPILNKYKIINLHISYLPFNRGANPNIWSHIDNTPNGVSIHYINEGIDTGDIIIQKKIILNENMTLKQSYKKLHFHIQLLFKEWILYKKNKTPKKQTKKGTFHLSKDLKKLNIPSYDITIKELKELNENRKN